MKTEDSRPRDTNPKSKLNPAEPVIQIPGPHPSDDDRPSQEKTHRDMAPPVPPLVLGDTVGTETNNGGRGGRGGNSADG